MVTAKTPLKLWSSQREWLGFARMNGPWPAMVPPMEKRAMARRERTATGEPKRNAPQISGGNRKYSTGKATMSNRFKGPKTDAPTKARTRAISTPSTEKRSKQGRGSHRNAATMGAMRRKPIRSPRNQPIQTDGRATAGSSP